MSWLTQVNEIYDCEEERLTISVYKLRKLYDEEEAERIQMDDERVKYVHSVTRRQITENTRSGNLIAVVRVLRIDRRRTARERGAARSWLARSAAASLTVRRHRQQYHRQFSGIKCATVDEISPGHNSRVPHVTFRDDCRQLPHVNMRSV